MNQEHPPSRPPGPTHVRWIVLGLVAFASASAYLTRYCIAAANTTIQTDLGLDDKQLGQVMSAFALGYLLFQVPGGWLGNRFGTRFAFAFISVFWSLSNVWSAASSGLKLLCASRFSLGAFQAGLTPISAKILKDWISLPTRGISSAAITACMSIGGAVTLSFTGWLLDHDAGWRWIFAAYSVVGIAWAIGFYWFFRTRPEQHAGVSDTEIAVIRDSEPPTDDLAAPANPPSRSTNSPIPDELAMRLLKCPSLWGLCVQSFFRAAGYVFFVTWFFAFLEYAYDIDKTEAGALNSLPLIAVVIGSLIGGVIVDGLLRTCGNKWVSRSGTACVSLAICGLLTMASAWTSSATQMSVVIALGALFSGIGSPAAWAATIDIGGHHTSVVMGIMNMAGCLAGVILPLVLGNWFDQIRETGGSTSDWNLVIYLHAAFYFAAAASWLAVNPNRTIDH